MTGYFKENLTLVYTVDLFMIFLMSFMSSVFTQINIVGQIAYNVYSIEI